MRNTKTYRLILAPMLALLALLFFGAIITAAPDDLDPTFGVDGKVIDGSGDGSRDSEVISDCRSDSRVVD